MSIKNLSLIVAMDQNNVIGRDNQIPWHLSEDLQRFKTVTMGHPIIMGRKTFESIGRALPGRVNIVVTRDPHYRSEGVMIAHSLEEAFILAGKDPEIFVIGGAALYKEALDHANKIYLTLIEDEFDGDVIFPKTGWQKNFERTEQTEELVSEKDGLPYRFLTYVRKN